MAETTNEIIKNPRLFSSEKEIRAAEFVVASDTLEDTVKDIEEAVKNGLAKKSEEEKNSHLGRRDSVVVNIDNAKWEKEYEERQEKNLQRFKDLGLYKQLQELGIIYDPEQFKKSHVLLNDGKNEHVIDDNDRSVYDKVESEFDNLTFG